jgi:uncharacterized protein Yka (UPF0111/DUF47 family)
MSQTVLQLQVQECLQVMFEQYGLMNSIADQMLKQSLPIDQWHQSADRLRQISRMIEELERQAQPIKQKYRESGQQPAAEIAHLKDQLAAMMQEFLMKISRLEHQASKSKAALLPQIHVGVRAVQMQNAYAKYA